MIADEEPSFEQHTRSVFDQHHRAQATNPILYDRLVGLVSPEYFGVPADYFHDKVVLDAGCGSNANASYGFLAMGAAQVHSADIGVAWMDCARELLVPFADRSVLDAQDVLKLTYPDGRFDFVHCAGVLHHTADPARGFRELARVTRPGGYTYVTVMANGDGIIYDWVNLLRRRYTEDEAFRRIVNGLNGETLTRFIERLLDAKEQHEPSTAAERQVLLSFVDDDLALTIRDRLEAPTYCEFDFTEAQIRGWFEGAGYTDVRRITRYPRGFRNLRRFLAPMYERYDDPAARLLFGEGYVQMIGMRA